MHTPPALHDTLYFTQAYDAVVSVRMFKQGEVEMDPLMKPFSHGGVPMMLAGFAAQDLVRGFVLRNASVGQKNTEMGVQTALEIASIIGDSRVRRNVSGTERILSALTDESTLAPVLEIRIRI